MPVYEFRCPRCENTIEATLPVNHVNPMCCAQRGEGTCGTEMEKLISKSSFMLKGKGWAKDGY
jgi:putative FmdB family regulatory protein